MADVRLAAALLAVDPVGLGGAVLRAGAGPMRDAWLADFRALLPPGTPWRRAPATIGDEALLGGLDLTATLAAGRPVVARGLLAETDGGVVLLAMAERLGPDTAGRIIAVADSGEVRLERDGIARTNPARLTLIALDEGHGEEERPPDALLDRLAFHLDLTDLRLPLGDDLLLSKDRAPIPSPPEGGAHAPAWEGEGYSQAPPPDTPHPPPSPLRSAAGPSLSLRGLSGTGNPGVDRGAARPSHAPHMPRPQGERDDRAIAAARARLAGVTPSAEGVEALCATALVLGIGSLRAPLLALRAARALAALAGRAVVAAEDLEGAARLVLAPRATCLPTMEEEADESADQPPPDQPPPPDRQEAADQDRPPPDPAEMPPLADLVLAAAAASIPPGLLARLQVERAQRSRGQQGRQGAKQAGSGRGRPTGTRRGAPKRGQRLNLIETLRAAAPWQALRLSQRAAQSQAQPGRRIAVATDDLRTTRTKHRSRTATIFVVDASGSAAMQRLAEAKGAVELLLADCYVRRDEVAVLAFRGEGASMLLPPTRSLVRAKRSLADLPGGGGTPLAAGIAAAEDLALALRRRGTTPSVVLLTDGRANIARDGSRGRAKAGEDAVAAARALRAAGLSALLVDTSPWPDPAARTLATEMRAVYLPLPRADAATLSGAVRGLSAP
jgi:magnesium chelatase subunit D